MTMTIGCKPSVSSGRVRVSNTEQDIVTQVVHLEFSPDLPGVETPGYLHAGATHRNELQRMASFKAPVN